jgi:hypothetical protein
MISLTIMLSPDELNRLDHTVTAIQATHLLLHVLSPRLLLGLEPPALLKHHYHHVRELQAREIGLEIGIAQWSIRNSSTMSNDLQYWILNWNHPLSPNSPQVLCGISNVSVLLHLLLVYQKGEAHHSHSPMLLSGTRRMVKDRLLQVVEQKCRMCLG